MFGYDKNSCSSSSQKFVWVAAPAFYFLFNLKDCLDNLKIEFLPNDVDVDDDDADGGQSKKRLFSESSSPSNSNLPLLTLIKQRSKDGLDVLLP